MLGLGPSLTKISVLRRSSAPAFTPASIFTGTDEGFWADVRPSRLWQDVARTTPVTAAGQPVASWELTTRTGVIYATQATAGNRPLYQVDGAGAGYLGFDGADDWLDTSAITVVPNYQAFAAVYPTSVTGNRNILDADSAGTDRRRAQYLRTNGATPETIAFVSETPFTDTGPTVTINTKTRLAAIAISGTSVDVRTDGVSNGTTAVTGSINTFNDPISIGRFTNPASSYFSGRIYGLILRFGPNLTSQQITDTEAWLTAVMNP